MRAICGNGRAANQAMKGKPMRHLIVIAESHITPEVAEQMSEQLEAIFTGYEVTIITGVTQIIAIDK